ncbi:MAG: hypothetical protein ACJ73E_09280 [Mycobacteriales bacterium]
MLDETDLQALEESLDILDTPDALEQIRQAEDEISRGEAINADELHACWPTASGPNRQKRERSFAYQTFLVRMIAVLSSGNTKNKITSDPQRNNRGTSGAGLCSLATS